LYEYKFSCGGKELAKVLKYYGVIESTVVQEQKILCPFHADENPSMIVNFNNGNYFCFGCQKSGDALKFVIDVEKRNGLNDLQSLKKYFEILKSTKVKSLSITAAKKEIKSNKQLYTEAYDYYHGLSKINWKNDSDVKEVIEAKNYMKKRGFNPQTLNICEAKITYNKSYGIIFPMFDNGKFKGWVCRTMQKDIEKKRKYLYNKGFRRKNSLIGNYNNCEILFVVEGYMDMLKFIQNGVLNVVAILGWKMSDIQIGKIKQQNKIKYVVSALDNDECGRKGSKYLEKIFKEKYVRFSYLKGIKDPGEMDVEQFQRMYLNTLKKIKLAQDMV
jgi:DNA primase